MTTTPAVIARAIIAQGFFVARVRTLADCTRQHRSALRRDVIRRRRLLGLRP